MPSLYRVTVDWGVDLTEEEANIVEQIGKPLDDPMPERFVAVDIENSDELAMEGIDLLDLSSLPPAVVTFLKDLYDSGDTFWIEY